MPKAIHPLNVILRPLITEKGTRLGGENKHLFEVRRGTNKHQIKQPVEKAFSVHVTQVNVINVKGKPKRIKGNRIKHSPVWRKAVVTLAPEDKIELFEGM